MASERSGLTSEGALYEAYARGNKDEYFFVDNMAKSLNVFETRYDPFPPHIEELRRIPPLNGADFGRSCEFELEVAGDLVVAPTILIDLPTWLPPEWATQNGRDLFRDASGFSIGYTNGIAYFLFSKIQIYQDKILLQEFSGDALFAARAARGSLNSAYLENTLAGFHDGSTASIGYNATPPRLRLELPFLSCGSRGFPSIAVRKQSFKIRLELRPLDQIVESSNPNTYMPVKPWEAPLLYTALLPPQSFKPLSKEAMGPPTLQLETRHVYTDGETQLDLRSKSLEIPFSRLYENTFTFGSFEYAPIDRGSTAAVTKRLDAEHPASRLLWFMRSDQDLRAGRRWKLTADISGGEYYVNESLIIAARDREILFPPLVWNLIQHHAKEERDPGGGLGVMNWDLGDCKGRRLPREDERQPEGSVNFSTADRPTLYTELAAIPPDPLTGRPGTTMTAIVDTWGLYAIEDDRGFLKYGN